MNLLAQSFLKKKIGIFNTADIAMTLGGTRNSRNALIKRAIKSGDIINVRRGLYVISNDLSQNPISQYAISQRIYGPSYVSMESALSYHGWIPEAVYVCTCTSYKKSCVFDTPLGLFSYRRVPQSLFFSAVDRVCDKAGDIFFVATPAKALCDYVYVKLLSWKISDAMESLRIDGDFVRKVKRSDLVRLAANYNNSRIKKFLKSWINLVESEKL